MKPEELIRLCADIGRLRRQGMTNSEIADSFNKSNVPVPHWIPANVQDLFEFGAELYRLTKLGIKP